MSIEINKIISEKHPIVSVCVASYNNAHFLGEMIDSILAQTFQDFELIIVDDGSKDNSLDILKKYAEDIPQLKVLTHPNNQNRGVSITANLAIENSRGVYIAFIGSDDAWYPNFLESQIKLLEIDESIGMIYSLSHYIDENSQIIPGIFGKNVTDTESTLKELISGNKIPALTAVVRRRCLDKVGLYDDNLAYSDWELWIRIAAHYTIKFNPTVLAKYRIHSSNMSVGISVNKDSKYSSDVVFALKDKINKIGGELPKYANFLQKYHGEWVTDYCLNQFFDYASKGNLTEGYKYLHKAFIFYPRVFLRINRLAAITKHIIIGIYRQNSLPAQ